MSDTSPANVMPGVTRHTSAARTSMYRKRRRRGIRRIMVSIDNDQLDFLEVEGYLDPDKRHDRREVGAAFEAFLGDRL